MSNVMDMMHEYSSVTTAHGIQYICGPNLKTIRRLCWLVILLSMIGGFVTMFIISMHKYLMYESTTSISYEHSSSLTLPAVTVCNINIFKMSAIQEKYPALVEPFRIMQQDAVSLLLQEAFIKALPVLINTTVVKFLDDVKFSSDEMIIQCSIGFQNILANCSNYTEVLLTDKGICYTFNSMKIQDLLVATNPGMIYGISLTLDITPHEYIFPMVHGTGMLVTIHDQLTYPRLEQKSFMVHPGKQVLVSLKKEIIEVLPQPYSTEDCVADSQLNLTEAYVETGYPYSEERCLHECQLKFFESSFGDCSLWGSRQNMCSMLAFMQLGEAMLEHGKGEFNCACPPTCHRTEFQTHVSYGEFGHQLSEKYAQAQNWSATALEDMRKRYSEIRVYYESMKYTKIVQQPAMDIEQLFSNLGGQMGLYLGASLITVVELLELFLRLCLHRLYRSKATKVQGIKGNEEKPNTQEQETDIHGEMYQNNWIRQ